MSEDWRSYSIAELVDEDRPICYGVLKPGDYYDQGVPLVRIVDVEGDKLNEEGLFRISAALDREFHRSRLLGGELVVSIQGTIGRVAFIPSELRGANISRTLARLSIKPDYIAEFVRFSLVSEHGQRLLADAVMGTTRDSLNIGALRKIQILLPNKHQQRRIATILTTLDEEIEATEALMAKHQQIKAGLMHDLFTRGLWTQAELARGDHKGLPCEATAKEGHLRPTPEEAPGLYQNSPLGLIPKAWRCEEVASLLANTAVPMRSGPFGSALLKDELVENGIPLLGIDNVFVERFEPTFRRFVSPWKFLELSRYEAFAGDVVITIMGTVGRCCVIPDDIGQALSSKHLWTMTFDLDQILPDLVCWQLNHAAWVKNWFLRHAQGAVMDAIQSSTLRTLQLPVPPITEQHQILARYRSISNSIETDLTHLAKLRQQKQGLMHDLLTGRVRVDGERGFDSQS